MAGLLYKDWLLLRRQLWYYALLLGLYLALTAAGVLDASFLCGLAVLYGTLLPTTCFSYDEAVHWERYAAATPAGRRGTVDGKYLLALLLAAKGNRKPLDIMQPGGSSLHVHIPDDDQGKAFIDGPVDLVARGRVWLPDAQA